MVGFRLWRRDAVRDVLRSLPLNLARAPDDMVVPKERVSGAAVGMRYAVSFHAWTVAGGREVPCRRSAGEGQRRRDHRQAIGQGLAHVGPTTPKPIDPWLLWSITRMALA